MNLSEQYNQLEQSLQPFLPLITKASDTVREQDVSDYPIMVATKDRSIEVGIPLTPETTSADEWRLSASTLEEFMTKQLILPDRIEDFKSIYKDPEAFSCIFVVEKTGATFVFIPRKS